MAMTRPFLLAALLALVLQGGATAVASVVVALGDPGGDGCGDVAGRSLRDFDLTTRLFKYPCSFLIYSPQFDGLPDEDWIQQL